MVLPAPSSYHLCCLQKNRHSIVYFEESKHTFSYLQCFDTVSLLPQWHSFGSTQKGEIMGYRSNNLKRSLVQITLSQPSHNCYQLVNSCTKWPQRQLSMHLRRHYTVFLLRMWWSLHLHLMTFKLWTFSAHSKFARCFKCFLLNVNSSESHCPTSTFTYKVNCFKNYNKQVTSILVMMKLVLGYWQMHNLFSVPMVD